MDFPSVNVTASAEVSTVPDYALMSFSIDTRASSLDKAVADQDKKRSSVVAVLQKFRVEPRHIQTNMVKIDPHYPYKGSMAPWGKDGMSPDYFTVSRGLTVRIMDLSCFEDISSGLVKTGVNKVTNVTFHSSNLRQHRDEARHRAICHAKEKSGAMARALGATLGPVHKIQEQHSGYRYNRTGSHQESQNMMCDNVENKNVPKTDAM